MLLQCLGAWPYFQTRLVLLPPNEARGQPYRHLRHLDVPISYDKRNWIINKPISRPNLQLPNPPNQLHLPRPIRQFHLILARRYERETCLPWARHQLHDRIWSSIDCLDINLFRSYLLLWYHYVMGVWLRNWDLCDYDRYCNCYRYYYTCVQLLCHWKIC